MALIGLCVVIMRLKSVFNEDIHDIFAVATILTATLPYFLFVFATNYFDLWSPWRRQFLRMLFLLIALASTVLVIETITDRSLILVHDSIKIAADGAILYQYGPWIPLSGVVILTDELAVIITLFTAIQQWRRGHARANKRVIIGIAILASGMTLIPVPGLEHLAFEQIFYSVGSVLLIGPILGQRLFDPISQLNRKLSFRAEQMALNNRISLLANSTLSLKELLPSVVYAVREAFGYDGVEIAITKLNGDILEYAANLDGEEMSAIPVGDIELSARFPFASEVPLKLSTGDSRLHISGTLKVLLRDGHRHSVPEDPSVIQALIEPIAVAIRNALLFEEVQSANAAKSNFVNHISHELRNGISNIVQVFDLVLHIPNAFPNVSLPEPYLEPLQRAEQDGRFVKALLTDVLDLSKIEAGKIELHFEKVELAPLFQEIQKGFIYGLKDGVEFKVEYDGCPCVSADPLRLRQILRNLVENAAKFTAAGYIRVCATTVGQRVQISVEDTGRGMAPEEIANLFKDFHQSSPEIYQKYGGTGIGLSLSRELTMLHGDDIWVTSERGKGSIFSFSLATYETNNC